MDRNVSHNAGRTADFVALRKESVDRNHAIPPVMIARFVALRKESVDRNISMHSSSVPETGGRSPQGERG